MPGKWYIHVHGTYTCTIYWNNMGIVQREGGWLRWNIPQIQFRCAHSWTMGESYYPRYNSRYYSGPGIAESLRFWILSFLWQILWGWPIVGTKTETTGDRWCVCECDQVGFVISPLESPLTVSVSLNAWCLIFMKELRVLTVLEHQLCHKHCKKCIELPLFPYICAWRVEPDVENIKFWDY